MIDGRTKRRQLTVNSQKDTLEGKGRGMDDKAKFWGWAISKSSFLWKSERYISVNVVYFVFREQATEKAANFQTVNFFSTLVV
jgi:hypothetical protein